MSASPARIAAFDILLRVETQEAYAVELLHSEKVSRLSVADRNLAMQLVMGVLRWQSRLNSAIAEIATGKNSVSKLDPEVRIALRLAVFQLRFLERIPESAAVNESVELVKRARKRSAVPFVNAVLRKIARGAEPAIPPSLSTAEELAKWFSHPQWLVEGWVNQFGFEKTKVICEADQATPKTSLRLNVSADVAQGVIEELNAEGVEAESGALLTSALRVVSGDVTRTAAFRERRVAIQDEASQLVAALVGRGARILDCCAAPGGKTSAIALNNPEAEIIAVELYPQRAQMMQRFITAPNVQVIAADATDLPISGSFDRILADVPCSGTGTLARNPEIKWKLQQSDSDDLHKRQVAILNAALDKVGPNGRVVYSTCSLEERENVGVVDEALRGKTGFRILDCGSLLEELKTSGALIWHDIDALVDGPYLRTLQGVHPCDGFFAAVIEKYSNPSG
ncbi:MAG: sun protein [Candidatus Angelobacter sp.]|nr:sun protein [Candidatus Angelobacter sp.]